MLTDIPCKFNERQWMRSGKAWRCILELPDNQVLAAGLTALIERKVKTTIIAPDGMNVTIDPAFILDVRSKGRKYLLVVETVYEHQKEHGPHLTAMTSQSVRVSIEPLPEDAPTAAQAPAEGKIGKVQLQGLHSTFFKNPRFQRFVETQAGRTVTDADSCKEAFKALHGIESCKDLDADAFRDFLKDFNTWINGGAA